MLAGSSNSACFQSPSWPRRQTVPSVLAATTTPGSAAGEAIRSAPAPRSGEPGSGTAAVSCVTFATCLTVPPGSISQASVPTVTTPPGGNAVSDGAVAKFLPPSVDRSAAPASVRTRIVSPMAETCAMSTPRSATGLHHGGAAAAGALPATSPISTMPAAVPSIRARRCRRSEPIEPLDDAELQCDVGDGVDDHRRPQRVGAPHQPAEPEADQERDRHKRGLGSAVADRQVGEPEDRGLADVGPPWAHGALQGSEQQAAELHLLRERLQRVCRTQEGKVAADGDRLQCHPAEHAGGEREPESDENGGPEHTGRKTAEPEAAQIGRA